MNLPKMLCVQKGYVLILTRPSVQNTKQQQKKKGVSSIQKSTHFRLISHHNQSN